MGQSGLENSNLVTRNLELYLWGMDANVLHSITLSLRATSGSVAISLNKQEIASSFHSSQ